MTPPSRNGSALLVVHAVATLLLATNVGVVTMMPLLALLRFGADEGRTLLVTAAVPTLLVASVFWHALLERTSLQRYLVAYWLVGVLPLAGIGAAQNYWHLLAGHVIAAAGAAGWTPIHGALLKHLYRDAIRGRAFGVLTVVTLVGQMGTLLLVGRWLTHNGDAFRVFLPLNAVVQAAGLMLIGALAAQMPPPAPPEGAARGWRDVFAPLTRMRRTLRSDPRFLRFEAAFMTYGCGFMICDALLPLLVTVKLGMDYAGVAQTAYIVSRGLMLAAVLPMGWLLDRVGAATTSAVSFGLLAAYPLLLAAAEGPLGLAGASAVFGTAMAGVMITWTLGPVAFAASPQRVSEYVAIHTTLVGLRGILFQGAGVLLYALTRSFIGPLLLAAAAFAWAAWQMRRLRRFDSPTAEG